MSVDLARVSLTVTDLLARRGPTTTDDLLLALREVPQLRGLDHRALLDDLGTDFAPGPWRPWVPAERDVPIEPGMVRSRRDGTRIREISEAALWFGQQQLPDGRWVASWSVMIDRVLTHRLTASEIDTGVALLDPDLAPMLLAAFWAQYYTNGASIDLCVLADLGLGDRVDVDDIGVLPGHTWVVLLGDVLPDGIGPGDLIGFQATRSGVVVRTVARAERFPDGAVRALTALVNDHPQGLRAAEAACALCVEVPELFSQGQRPFIELVVEAGVLHHDWWLLPAGTDIEEWEARQTAAAEEVDPARLAEPVADEDPDPDPDARALVEASDLATAKALLDRNFRSMYSDQGGTVWYCTDVRGFVTVVGSPDPVRADGDPRRLDTGTLRVLADTTELLDEALAELLEAPGTVLLERGRTNSQKG